MFKRISVRQGYMVLSAFLTVAVTVSVVTASLDGPIQNSSGSTVKFNHKFHVTDNGIACADCHDKATTSKLSSDNLLAVHENCKSCHEEQLGKNCTYCHTSDDAATYVATQLPKKELLFSHEFHVGEKKVVCETCHDKVASWTDLSTASTPPMPTCTTCHNERNAPNACETCHTDLTALRPKEHNRSDFMREHKFVARVSTAKCATCHTQESCIDCHNGTELKKVDLPNIDLTSPHSPRLTAIDRGQGMAVAKVHDLNFRFTHGLEAQGKTAECQTCHNEQSFCATCHQAGGNINQVKFKPTTHAVAGFVTIGVGSGGGTHAMLARRDIESCASCHDAQGADPTCLTCHTDADGIKGTDPKTHQLGFMATTEGDWHRDPGSTCYACHTDANARIDGIRGQRFCGYCHN